MKKVKEILTFLLFITLEFVLGDVFFNFVDREDPCVNLCEKTPLTAQNNDSPIEKNKYFKSCCQRGCRFFNLVDLSRGLETDSINSTRNDCEASCTEAYTNIDDRNACRIGCDSMAKLRISELLSLFSVAILVEENVGINSNVLLMAPDIPDNDILTDPSLRKELFPGWWDSEGFKLPQTYVKTVPVDSGTIDYGIPSDYAEETERSISLPGSDWLQCASRHTGIPRWLLGSAILGAALSILWLCLFPKESSNTAVKESNDFEKEDLTSKVMVYIPDEAPLYKTPPPKYSELEGMT